MGTEGKKEEAAGWFSTAQDGDQQSDEKRETTMGGWEWVSKDSNLK